VFGQDQTFTTSPRIGVRIVGRTAKVDHRHRAAVKLRAVGPADEVAEGKLTLFEKVGGHRHKLGTATYRITVGQTKKIRVKLNRAARQALQAAPRRRLRVTASAKTRGNRHKVTKKLTLAG
jgi:hypothetical protein